MTTQPTAPASPGRKLPPLRTVRDIRTALGQGYGFEGDADAFEAELATALSHAEAADLSEVTRVIQEFQGRIITRLDPDFEAAVAAGVAEIAEFRALQKDTHG